MNIIKTAFKKNAINATYKSIRLAIFCVKNVTGSVGVVSFAAVIRLVTAQTGAFDDYPADKGNRRTMPTPSPEVILNNIESFINQWSAMVHDSVPLLPASAIREKTCSRVVSFAAVIRVVTQRFSPTNGCLNQNPFCFRGLANHNIPHIFLRRSRQG